MGQPVPSLAPREPGTGCEDGLEGVGSACSTARAPDTQESCPCCLFLGLRDKSKSELSTVVFKNSLGRVKTDAVDWSSFSAPANSAVPIHNLLLLSFIF